MVFDYMKGLYINRCWIKSYSAFAHRFHTDDMHFSNVWAVFHSLGIQSRISAPEMPFLKWSLVHIQCSVKVGKIISRTFAIGYRTKVWWALINKNINWVNYTLWISYGSNRMAQTSREPLPIWGWFTYAHTPHIWKIVVAVSRGRGTLSIIIFINTYCVRVF